MALAMVLNGHGETAAGLDKAVPDRRLKSRALVDVLQIDPAEELVEVGIIGQKVSVIPMLPARAGNWLSFTELHVATFANAVAAFEVVNGSYVTELHASTAAGCTCMLIPTE